MKTTTMNSSNSIKLTLTYSCAFSLWALPRKNHHASQYEYVNGKEVNYGSLETTSEDDLGNIVNGKYLLKSYVPAQKQDGTPCKNGHAWFYFRLPQLPTLKRIKTEMYEVKPEDGGDDGMRWVFLKEPCPECGGQLSLDAFNIKEAMVRTADKINDLPCAECLNCNVVVFFDKPLKDIKEQEVVEYFPC